MDAVSPMRLSSLKNSFLFGGFGSKNKSLSSSRISLSGDRNTSTNTSNNNNNNNKSTFPGKTTSAEQVERSGSERDATERSGTERNGYGGSNRELQSMPAVQKLYDACKKAFGGGGTPTQQALERVRLILDRMKPSDLGLDDSIDAAGDVERGFGMLGVNGRRGRPTVVLPRLSPPITYLELYDCDDFSMGIFCLPTSAALPLHNHPGMTVLSKVLYGSMHVKSYDWVNPADEKQNGRNLEPRLAKLVEDQVITAPCETEVLHPFTNNIHAFTAVTSCAVLDVLAPPYDASKGRHCTYFHEVFPSVSQGDYQTGTVKEQIMGGGEKELATAWLEDFRPPDDFVVQRGVYRGLKVVASAVPETPSQWSEENKLKAECRKRRRGSSRVQICTNGRLAMAKHCLDQPIPAASALFSTFLSCREEKKRKVGVCEVQAVD